MFFYNSYEFIMKQTSAAAYAWKFPLGTYLYKIIKQFIKYADLLSSFRDLANTSVIVYT